MSLVILVILTGLSLKSPPHIHSYGESPLLSNFRTKHRSKRHLKKKLNDDRCTAGCRVRLEKKNYFRCIKTVSGVDNVPYKNTDKHLAF